MATQSHSGPLTDLNDFRRDLLNQLDKMGPSKGLAVKEALEEVYDVGTVNHGRLYPALDDLVEKGLVEKSARDRRTNEYGITARGRRELKAHREWYSDE